MLKHGSFFKILFMTPLKKVDMNWGITDQEAMQHREDNPGRGVIAALSGSNQ